MQCSSDSFEWLQDKLLAFFEAENARDWEGYASFLAEDVVWTLHSAARQETLQGRAAYLARVQAAYGNAALSFKCLRVTPGDSAGKLLALLQDSNGKNAYEIFQFKDGLISQEWEFLLN